MSGKGGPNKRRRSAPKVKSSLDFLARLNQPDCIRPSDFLLDVVNQRATHIQYNDDGTSETCDVDVTFEQRFEAAVKLLPHELPKLASMEADIRTGNLTHEEALAQLEQGVGMKLINGDYTEEETDDISNETD